MDELKIIKCKTKKNLIEIKTYETNYSFKIVDEMNNGKLVSTTLKIPKKEENLYGPLFILKDNIEEEIKKIDFKRNFEFHEIILCLIKKDVIKKEDINLKNLYHIYTIGHMIFDLNKRPISIPVKFNYINSLTQRFPNDPLFKEIIDKLKKHDFIKEIEIGYIPSYNHDFYGQEGILNAISLLSQKEYEKIWDFVKGFKYPSCRIKDAILLNCTSHEYCPYGSEIKELLTEFNTAKFKKVEKEDFDNPCDY